METTAKTTLTGLDTLQLLASKGAKFCKVIAWNANSSDPGKAPFEDGWQNKPYTIDQVKAHLESGGNVGLLAGQHSGDDTAGHICILDVDENYSGFCAFFPWAQDAAAIIRDGADKGKIIIRIRGDLPASKSFKHKGERKPFFEFLSTGRQGVIAGTHPNGAAYTFANGRGMPIFTPASVNAICEAWAGQGLREFEALQAQERKAQTEATRQSGGDGLLESVLEYWTSLKIFQENGRAGDIRKKGDELRLAGNGGLFVDPDNNRWYCFTDEIGGGPFQAWQYCKDGTINVPTGRGFYDLLCEMATAANIPIPEHKSGKTHELPPEPDYPEDWPTEPPGEEIITPLAATQPQQPADPERFHIWTGGELLEPEPPIQWAVAGLIERGNVYIVFGDAGIGKTLVLMDLGFSLANGEAAWSGRTLTQTPVIWVDEESGKRRIKRRYQAISKAHGAGESVPFGVITMARIDLREPADVNALLAQIQGFAGGVVFIDALMEVIPGADENAAKDMTPGLLALATVAKKYDIAFVVIHHANKAGGYRGTSVLKGFCDGMYKLEGEQNSNIVIFSDEKMRDGARFTERLCKHFENSEDDPFHLVRFWVTQLDKKPEIPQPKGEVENGIYSFLLDNPHSTAAELATALDTTKGTIRNAISRLKEKGIVVRTDDNEKGKEATYRLDPEYSPSAVIPLEVENV